MGERDGIVSPEAFEEACESLERKERRGPRTIDGPATPRVTRQHRDYLESIGALWGWWHGESEDE